MLTPTTQAIPQGSMQLLQQQHKMRNGSPKMGQTTGKPMKSDIKMKKDARTGDAVSDESDDGDDAGAESAEDDEGSDDDEPNGFALSGARHCGNKAAARLAGPKTQDVQMMDDEHTSAGAEMEVGIDSDDDYAAVEEISDVESLNDDEEQNVLWSAEKDLIAEFERTEKPRQAKAMTNGLGEMSLKEEAAVARRLSLQSEGSQMDDLDLDLDFDADPFGGLQTNDLLYQELIEESEVAFDNDMLSSWRHPDADNSRENSMPSNGQKKVRFEETLSSRASSMSSDEDPCESFPDLFDGHSSSVSRQQLHVLGMNMDAVENESVFEFEDDEKALRLEASDTEMSDTDSDEGDTTDEESPEEQLARVQAYRAAQEAKEKAAGKKSPILKSAPSTPAAKRPTPPCSRAKAVAGRSATPNSSHRPKTGTFNVPLSQASVTPDIRGSGIKVVCPKNPPTRDRAYWKRARQAIGNRDGSPGSAVAWTPSAQQAPSIPKRPFTAKSTLGTMFDGNLDFLRDHDENGIAKEFLRSARKGSMQSSYTSNTMTSEASDSENNVNMADFVQLDDSDDDDDDEPTMSTMVSPTQDHFSDNFFTSSPVASRDTGNGLLDHFDQQRGLVSSFRNNQNHARHVSSLPANPARRAQISEANALQKGRRSAANAPITPARKKRQSQDLDATGAGIRKLASPLVQKHRRSRGSSLSGVHQTLALDRFAGGMQ